MDKNKHFSKIFITVGAAGRLRQQFPS